MNQAKDINSLKSPDVKHEDKVSFSQKLEDLSSNHIVDVHIDPLLSTSLSLSSECKTHLNHSGNLDVKIDIEFTEDTDESDYRPVDLSLKDADDDGEEIRPGFFDYMPSQSGHGRAAQTLHPAYDENVKLDSSERCLAVESVHVENCVSVDHEHRQEDCFSTDHEHHNEDCVATKHHVDWSAHLHKYTCWDYMPGGKNSEDEEMEDEEYERDCRQSSSNPSSFVPSIKNTTAKEVDESISYNLKSLSDHATGLDQQPNTVTPHSFYQDQLFSKESDLKNSRSKDDTDRAELSGQVDINGNPRLLDPANYLQWPRGKSENAASAGLSSYTPITIPHSHGSDPNVFDRKKERRRMRLERLKGTPAEEYKDHKKFNNIKEILAFVEGSKKSSKTESKIDGKTDGKTAKRKQERSRKKDHPFNGPLLLEDIATGDDASVKEDPAVVTSAQVAMGNSLRGPVGQDSISKTGTEEEEADRAEFHDCFNTLPDDLLTSEVYFAGPEKEQQNKIAVSGRLVKTDHVSSEAADISDSSSDSVTDIIITDSTKTVTKKQTKITNKKEKDETVNDNNGHFSLKSKMLKPSNDLAEEDSLVISDYQNNKTNSAINKELLVEVKREDSFTEVKKKKKKPGGKDSSATPTNKVFSLPNHFHINNRPRRNSRHHTQTSGKSQAPLSTVSYNNVSLTTHNQCNFSRDLSPSAFPVLSGQGAPGTLHAEARRNSCGDLTSESADSKTYDSDRESAKSLPAAHGTSPCEDISLVYLVSYARMAAAPPKDTTNSETSASSISSNLTYSHSYSGSLQSSSNQAATPERKATVWKGSPRERRHSIGSGPEDKPDTEKSSVTERNRQCGSQEVLNRSIVASTLAASKDIPASATLPASASVPVSASLPATLSNNCEESSSAPSHAGTQTKAPFGRLSNNQMVKTSTSSAAVTKSLPQKSLQKLLTDDVVSAENSTLNLINGSLIAPNTTVTLQSTIPSQSCQPHSTSAPSGALEANLNGKNISAQGVMTVCALQATANADSTKTVPSKTKLSPGPDVARKHNSSKSVIFLDKRYDSSSHQNLGITFGFDSSCETPKEKTSQQPQLLLSEKSEPLSAPPSSSASSQDPSVPMPQTKHTQENSYIPSLTLPNSKLQAGLPSKSSDNSSIMPKGPHINGPRNGMILTFNSSKNNSYPPNLLDSQNISNINIFNSSNDKSSICANNSNINLSASRTKPSQVNLKNPVSHGCLNSLTNNDLTTQSTISNLSFTAAVCNLPVQTPVPAPHEVTQNSCTQTTSKDDFQPPYMNDLQLPETTSSGDLQTLLPQKLATEIKDKNTSATITEIRDKNTVATITDIMNKNTSATSTVIRDKSTSVTLPSLPSDHTKNKTPQAYQAVSSSSAPTLREYNSVPQPLAEVEEATDAQENPITTKPALTAPTNVSSHHHHHTSVPPESQSLVKPVVYGLMIKPGVGCGKLLFKPTDVSKKTKGNSTEIYSFLRKRWLHDVIQKKGSETFFNLKED